MMNSRCFSKSEQCKHSTVQKTTPPCKQKTRISGSCSQPISWGREFAGSSFLNPLPAVTNGTVLLNSLRNLPLSSPAYLDPTSVLVDKHWWLRGTLQRMQISISREVKWQRSSVVWINKCQGLKIRKVIRLDI